MGNLNDLDHGSTTMRKQEYVAVALLAGMVLLAWYFEASKGKDREQARTEQVQETSSK